MNSNTDENSCPPPSSKITQKCRRSKYSVFRRPNTKLNENFENNLKIRSNETSKIFKIENCGNKFLKNIKIEFSKDLNLVDKLFEMKNALSIKKKTFI